MCYVLEWVGQGTRPGRAKLMLQQVNEQQLRDFYAPRTRSLAEAATAAHIIAETEQLPINATPAGSTEAWHRETMLKMVPVYGTHGRCSEQVPSGAHLEGDHALGDGTGEWTDLKIKGADFKRYLDWLHSIW